MTPFNYNIKPETPTLRSLRLRSGFNSHKICEIVGISRDDLYNFENGKNIKMRIDQFKKLSEILGIDLDQLTTLWLYERSTLTSISH